jgi:hypothetical protein
LSAPLRCKLWRVEDNLPYLDIKQRSHPGITSTAPHLKLKTSSLETPLLLPINFDVVHDGVAGDGEAEEALGGMGDAGGPVAADALAVAADAEGVALHGHRQDMPLAGFEGVGDLFLFAFEGLFLFAGQRGFGLAGFADVVVEI